MSLVVPFANIRKGKRLPDPAVVLCIDDELAALQLRAVILSLAGYEVLTANNAEQALDIVRFQRLDLVVLDQVLPDVEGTEVLRTIKLMRPELPVIMLSGFTEPPDGAEQADLFITKGIAPQEFLARIAGMIKNGQAR